MPAASRQRQPGRYLATYGEKARQAAGLDSIARIPGKHFPQEDQAAAIAGRIAEIAGTAAACSWHAGQS